MLTIYGILVEIVLHPHRQSLQYVEVGRLFGKKKNSVLRSQFMERLLAQRIRCCHASWM